MGTSDLDTSMRTASGVEQQDDRMNGLLVGDVMTHLVVTLRAHDTIHEAARRLIANRVSGAPVTDQGYLIGVVAVPDLVGAYMPTGNGSVAIRATDPLLLLLHRLDRTRGRKKTVGDVMKRDVVSISPEAGVWEAAATIDRHGVKRLPVIDSDALVIGVIARSDLIRAMVSGTRGLP
jgi:CBS domain-containing protein